MHCISRFDINDLIFSAFSMKPAFFLSLIATLLSGVTFLLALVAMPGARGAQYEIDWSQVSVGGTMFRRAGSYEINGTIGQHDAGVVLDHCLEVQGGFWVLNWPGDSLIGATGPVADLEVIIEEKADPVTVTADLLCVIRVNNHGPAIATGVFLTNTLPAGLQLVSAASIRPVAVSGNRVIGQLGAVNPGTCAEIELVLRATAPGLYTNSVVIGAAQSDPFPYDNSAVQITTVTAREPLLFTWTGAVSPDWFNRANWIPTNGPPSLGDTATISSGTVRLGSDAVIGRLIQSGGSLTGSNALRIAYGWDWSGGTMNGTGTVALLAGGTGTISGNASGKTIDGGWTIQNAGTLTWTGSGSIALNQGTWNNSGVLEASSNASLSDSDVNGATFNNTGVFRKTGGTGITAIDNLVFNNSGALEIQSGTVAINRNYTATASSVHRFAIGGYTAGTDFGRLTVAGTVNVAGSLDLILRNQFTPTNGAAFAIVGAGVRNGTFISVTGQSMANGLAFNPTYRPDGVVLNVTGGNLPVVVTLGPAAWTNQRFQFRLTGNPGATYRIDSSTNLVQWTAIATQTIPTAGFVVFGDSATANFQLRFYRAVLVP